MILRVLRSGRGLHRGGFFLRFFFGGLLRLFLCGSFWLRNDGLVLILFRWMAQALRMLSPVGLYLFSLSFFRSLRLLFRFFDFAEADFSPLEAAARSSGLFPFRISAKA